VFAARVPPGFAFRSHEVAVREVAVQMLKRNGYRVISTPSGEAAIAHCGEHRATIDLLFFDVMMPGLGGFEAAARCRLLKPEIPVLFASGYAAGALAERSELPPGTQILQKPYRVEDLLQAVQRLLNC
jgi:CheY-like chemotaxis protein